MTERAFYIYAASVLCGSDLDGLCYLNDDYDYCAHRLRVEMLGTGNDPAVRARVSDLQDTVLAEGTLNIPACAFMSDTRTGQTHYLERIVIDGQHFGFYCDRTLRPGRTYTARESGTFDFSEIPPAYPYLRNDAMILTSQGEQPLGWIEPGVRVVTRDHGLQPVLAVLRWTHDADWCAEHPAHRPQKIYEGGLDGMRPTERLVMSPDSRIFHQSPEVELAFGMQDVLVPMSAWASGDLVEPAATHKPRNYAHLVFGQHEMVQASGIWVDSFFPGPQEIAGLDVLQRHALRDTLGDQMFDMLTARLCLTTWEAALVIDPPRTDVAAVASRA